MLQMLEMKMNHDAPEKSGMQISSKDKKFVRYIDGAELYSMHPKTFEKLARDANARYKIGKMVLVNTQIIDKYLETCRLIES